MVLNINEDEYRALAQLSQSDLKNFIKDSRKFHKKYILKEYVTDEEDGQFKDAMLFGQIVDTLLTREEQFDHKFCLDIANRPTGQLGDFCQSLYKYTNQYTVDGKLTEEMDFLYGLAYKEVGFKRDTLDKVKEKFATEGLAYYTVLRDRGKRLLISQKDYEQANYLIDKLRTHPYCSGLINLKSNDRFIVEDQMVITGHIAGVEMKAMLDRVITDKKEGKIFAYDYKIGSNGEMFKINYPKLGYYVQLAVYTLLLRENYPDYEVLPLRFLAVDRTMYFDPLKYKSTEQHLEQALRGFKKDGRKYKGLYEMLLDYRYAMENDHWSSSRQAHLSKGEVDIDIYEKI